MAAFLASAAFILLAEMGDKTQLLAMAFATRYDPRKVLFAVFLATLANHALAVAAGHFLSVVIPLDIISFLAALSFLAFAVWTLRGDTLDGGAGRPGRFGPVATVAIAFFLAEMGDKTQLATLSLAIEYRNMLHVLLGTTFGMVAADAIGITAGIVLKKHIPERGVKIFSATVFAAFGLIGIYTVLTPHIGKAPSLMTASLIAVCAAIVFRVARRR